MLVIDYYRGFTPSPDTTYRYIRSSPNGSGILQLARGQAVLMRTLDTTDDHYRTFSPKTGWIWRHDLVNVEAVYKEVAAPTVPKVASQSIPMGGSFVVTATPDLASFTHQISLTVGGAAISPRITATNRNPSTGVQTWTIATDTTSGGVNWLTFAPNATSVAGVLTLKTYQANGTLEGSVTLNLTFTVPSNVIPTAGAITVSRAAGDPTDGLVTQYVQGKTRLKISMAASAPGTASSMASVTLKAEGKTLGTWTGAAASQAIEHASYVPVGYGSLEIEVTAKDSRGRSATRKTTIQVSRYYAPVIGNVVTERCNAQGVEDPNGGSLAVRVPVDAALQGGQLTLTITLALAPVSTGTYVSLGTVLVGTRKVFASVVNPDVYYLLKVTASDGLSTTQQLVEVEAGLPVMSVWRNGLGLGFGMTANRPGVMEIGGKYRPAGDGIFETWSHTKVGTVHQFTGAGTTGKVRFRADFLPGDTFTVNGTPVTAVTGGQALQKWIIWRWALLIYDTSSPYLYLFTGDAPDIRYGSILITAPAGGVGNATVPFSPLFSAVPIVVATVTTSRPDLISVSTFVLTASEANFNLYNGSGSSGNWWVRYIAAR